MAHPPLIAPIEQAHGVDQSASAWVQRWSHLVAPGQTVLDVACGEGRHVNWFVRRGHRVIGLDRSASALAAGSRLSKVVSRPTPMVAAIAV